MEIEKVYPTQSTFWKFILFSKCTWYWLGSSMKYSFYVGPRRGWAGLSRVHVTSVRRGMDIVTRRELESSQLPCWFVTLVWQYRQCVTVSVTVQHLIQDNDHNLMMLAAGGWLATALSWGQCYEIFCVWAKTGEQDHCWLLCHNPTAGGCSRAGPIWIYHRCPLHVKTGFIAWHCEIPRAIIMELISELQLWLVVSLTSLNLCPFSLSEVWNNPLQR